MRPSQKLLNFLLLCLALAFGLFAMRIVADQFDMTGILSTDSVNTLKSLWWSCVLLLVGTAVFDAIRHRSFRKVQLERELPHSLSLGVHAKVTLNIKNPYYFPLKITLTDIYPEEVEAIDIPIQLTIAAYATKNISYPVLPIKRGSAEFGQTCLRINTRWGLWQKLEHLGESQSVKVYPNFSAITHSSTIALEHQISQLGIHLQQRRGEGSDFHQLREFREGDTMRQIDWKATSRHRKPISRDYQDERDQEIVFLLDCGRRLRNKDDQISHFDHALNALLLTSYIALRQGDAVGLMSFAGNQRWMSPIKGPAHINTILNKLYDLHSTTTTTDYLQAAEQLLARHKKRALIVIITNLQESDADDITAAVKLLRKKHVVMVASLRDAFLDNTLDHQVRSFEQALSYCGTIDITNQRQNLLKKLQALNIIMTDSLPKHLHIDLVNEYFKVKRSGRL